MLSIRTFITEWLRKRKLKRNLMDYHKMEPDIPKVLCGIELIKPVDKKLKGKINIDFDVAIVTDILNYGITECYRCAAKPTRQPGIVPHRNHIYKETSRWLDEIIKPYNSVDELLVDLASKLKDFDEALAQASETEAYAGLVALKKRVITPIVALVEHYMQELHP